MIRPGPAALRWGTFPGGIVVHVYAVPTQRLILTTAIPVAISPEVLDYRAAMESDRAFRQLHPDEYGVCIVTYDGDTGERITPSM